MEYTIERLSGTTFVLRPDYDATVAELGGEPPLGLPEELTFEWALAQADDKVRRERRAAERKAAAQRRSAEQQVKPTPKAPPRKAARRPRKSTGTP